jgi:hypothetical protein
LFGVEEEEEEDAAMRSRSSCNKLDRFALAILSLVLLIAILLLSRTENYCDFILFNFPPKMLFTVLQFIQFNSISFCLFYFLACFFPFFFFMLWPWTWSPGLGSRRECGPGFHLTAYTLTIVTHTSLCYGNYECFYFTRENLICFIHYNGFGADNIQRHED